MYYVYLLTDGAETRIGCTNDLASLLHDYGQPPYFTFSNRETASNFAKYLKSPSGRAFIKSHEFIDLYLLANALQYAYEKSVSHGHPRVREAS
ncbi:hypothetical protein HYS00_04105 [Candidatus Microgenomates bacterium]|nr:hypothetical protein [Candidatus Microgenomates bacterium]